jgi:gluconate 2-dehydrogenase gamma chain
MADDTRGPARISRRDLLKSAGAAGAAALIPGAAGAESTVAPGAPAPTAPAVAPEGPLMNLTAQETEILSAMVDRLIPSDDMGPGALEAGALRYIDRALSEAESDSVGAYRTGLAALDNYSRYSRGSAFIELSDRDKDSVLIDVQLGGATGAGVGFVGSSGSFFNMVKSHTWQGTFGDPMYGGNVNFIGWDILGYPGVRMRVSAEDQRLMEAGELPPARRSAYEYGQFQTIRGDD